MNSWIGDDAMTAKLYGEMAVDQEGIIKSWCGGGTDRVFYHLCGVNPRTRPTKSTNAKPTQPREFANEKGI